MASESNYSTGISAKGALLDETLTVMRELDRGATIDEVRRRVLEVDLLGKDTVSTRESVWKRIHARYLGDPARAALIARMATRAPDPATRALVLFFEFCRANPLLHDVTARCVFPRYRAGFAQIDAAHVQRFLDDAEAEHPELADWSPQTRKKVVSNILTILRDVGLLEGVQQKRFTRLYVPLPAFVYALYSLRGDGITTPTEVLTAEAWRRFLLVDEDVVALLEEAAAAGHGTFKHQGDIYVLDFAYPSLEVCVAALT